MLEVGLSTDVDITSSWRIELVIPNPCNSTKRIRARLLICQLVLHHPADHVDGDMHWPAGDGPTLREVLIET
jgi:hypothetical protein